MGCSFGLQAETKQLQSLPRQLPNMCTFIPLDYSNGEYTSKYPFWLKNKISFAQYSLLISKLNALNKSSLLWNKKRIAKYKKLSDLNAKKLIKRDQRELNSDT
eukprot:898934_1